MAIEFGSDDEIVVPALQEFGAGDAVVGPNEYDVTPERRQAATATLARLRQLREEQDAALAAPRYRLGVQLPFMDEPIASVPIAPELAAFGSEAAKSVLPTGAGLAAASAVTPYSNAAANLVGAVPGYGRLASPIVRYGAPLVAAGVAGLGTRTAQDVALPQILPEDAARSYELTGRLAGESPTAAMLGQFAGAGPFFRPGLPVNSAGNARVALPLIAGGIGAGIEGAQQLAAGEFDPQRLAVATAGSALLNRETALGRRIGPNLVLPDIAGPVPDELATMGRILREPVLPEATATLPSELDVMAQAGREAQGDIAAANMAGTTTDEIQLRRLAERMAGKTPEQQLAVVKQEVALQKDVLTADQKRAALEIQQGLEARIAQQNAAEDVAKAVADQQKAVQDAQQTQADAAIAASQPPELPKSAQILAENQTKPPSIANVATEVATQTKQSPYALQTRLNELTAVQPTFGAASFADNTTAPIKNLHSGMLDQSNPDRLRVAARTETGEIVTSPEARIHAQLDAPITSEMGFVTQSGEFLTRKQADSFRNATESKAASVKAAVDNPTTEWLYTVQRPMVEGGKGFIQVDAIAPEVAGMERNTVSSNPADLRAAGADIPDVPDWVPQGQYTLEQINALIKQGEPKRAIPEQVPAQSLLGQETTRPELPVELPGVAERNAIDSQVARAEAEIPSSLESTGLNPRSRESIRQASRMRQTRGAIGAQTGLTVGGAGAGGVTGFVATDREPGETDEEYNARRLRNAAIGAAAGAGTFGGIGALARGAQRLRENPLVSKEASDALAARLKGKSPEEQAAILQEFVSSGRAPIGKSVPLPDTEKNQGIRRTAEKIIENRQYPEQLRQTLADNPDIIYNKFALNDLADRVSAATEAELATMRGSTNLRERLGATAELANRLSLSNDPALQAQGAALYSELAQNLTDPAQLLGLGKLVKTPQGYITAINEKLKDVKRTLSKPQEDQLRRLGTDAIKSEQELASASRAAESDYSHENEATYRAAQKKNADAKKALDDFVHRVSPEGWDQLLSKTIQGNLLTPLSLVANVFGNTVYQPVRRTAASFASALDAIYSVGTGKERTIARLNPFPAVRELGAAAEGIKIAGKELLTGPSADSYIKGEVQRGFRPMRSLVQAFSGKDLAVRPDGTVALNDRAKKLYEGLVGIAPETMFRFLSLGDKPFRRAAEAELLLEQARLKGLKGRELDRFLEFPDKATQELLNTEGRRAIFAQDNPFSTRLNAFLDHGLAEAIGADKIPALKGALKVFGRLVVPFRQFPLNYVNTALNFAAPELATAKAIYHASRGDRRKALQNLGEGALGTMIYGAANYLWDNGLISEPTDKDAKARSVQYEQMGPQRINVTGLNRALDGGDGSYKIGDLTMDWGRLGIPSANFYVFTRNAAKGRKESAQTGENRNPAITPATAVSDRLSAFPGMASFALDQSFLSGTSALLEAMRNPDPEGQEFQNWASNTFRAVSSIPVPNTVEALARSQFQYIPELKGDNLTETLKNTWRYKTLQISDADRPLLKRDLWGDSISRVTPGENPYITQFVDVTRAQRKPGDAFKQQLVDLYKVTESPDVYPGLPTRNITVEGITAKLTPDDYDKYQQLVGNARREFAGQVAANPRFVDVATIPEAKILALQEAYSEGAKVGKERLLALPGVAARYFPELVGLPVARPEDSRVVARDPKARGRLRVATPPETFGEGDEAVP